MSSLFIFFVCLYLLLCYIENLHSNTAKLSIFRKLVQNNRMGILGLSKLVADVAAHAIKERGYRECKSTFVLY